MCDAGAPLPTSSASPAAAAAASPPAVASLVADRPELVSCILRHLDSGSLARAELVSRVFLREGRRERLGRNEVSILDRSARRTRTGYLTESGYRCGHFEVVPMHRHARYPTREALLHCIRRSRTVPVSSRLFGWSDFFRHLYCARRGMLRTCPSSPALGELAHFKGGLEEDLAAIDPGFEDKGGLRLRFTEQQHAAIKSAFLSRAATLSYGSLYLACYFAKYLRHSRQSQPPQPSQPSQPSQPPQPSQPSRAMCNMCNLWL